MFGSVELGRFVLLDDVPGNGETWFLGRCFHMLRLMGLRGVLNFSDPAPRSNQDGSIVFPGHVGTIYQAFNGIYLGRGRSRTIRLLPDGRVLSERAISKIRHLEQGSVYSIGQLVQAGAVDPGATADRGWLSRWLKALTRKLRHRGNHKYAWPLHRTVALPPGMPFPKTIDHRLPPGHRGRCGDLPVVVA